MEVISDCEFLLLRFGAKMSAFTVSRIHQETLLHISILIHILGPLKNVAEHGWMRFFPEVEFFHVMVCLSGYLLHIWFATKLHLWEINPV